MAEFPALMLWTDAYLGDTTHLGTEEHGAYLLLLMAAWRSKGCCLPDDDLRLARMCRCTMKRWREKLRPVIEPFFTVADGKWTQKRLTKESKHCEQVRAKKREAAHAKHLKYNDTPPAPAGAPVLQVHVQPLTLTTTKKESKKESPNGLSMPMLSASAARAKQTKREYPAEFEELWAAYPRREEDSKAECLKHWRTVIAADNPASILTAACAYRDEHDGNEFRFGLRRWLGKKLYRNPVPKRRDSQEEDVIGKAHRMTLETIRKMNGHEHSEDFAGTHSVVPGRPPPSVWSGPEDDGRALVVAERPLHRSTVRH